MAKYTRTFLWLAMLLMFLSAPLMQGCENYKYSENYVETINDVVHFTLPSTFFTSDAERMWKDIEYLKTTKIRQIKIFLNSTGGDIYPAFAYVDMFKQARKQGFIIEIEAHGIIASAAVPVFVSADIRKCGEDTLFMLHKPYVPEMSMYYPSALLEQQRRMVAATATIYIQILVRNTYLTADEVDKMLSVEGTWFGAKKAKQYGFVDEIL